MRNQTVKKLPSSLGLYCKLEVCADLKVPAAARRSVLVGVGGAPPINRNRRRRLRGAAWSA